LTQSNEVELYNDKDMTDIFTNNSTAQHNPCNISETISKFEFKHFFIAILLNLLNLLNDLKRLT